MLDKLNQLQKSALGESLGMVGKEINANHQCSITKWQSKRSGGRQLSRKTFPIMTHE